MALTFTVIKKELTGGGYQTIAPRAAVNSQTVTWEVLAEDDNSPPLPGPIVPDTVTELDVLGWKPGGFRFWPEVNVDLFTHVDIAGDIQVQPWLICDSLRAIRDPSQRLKWRVTATYSSGMRTQITQDQLSLVTAPAPGGVIAAYPYIEETIWGGDQRIIEEENDQRESTDPDVSNQDLLLPTGNLFTRPFYGRFPKRVIRQTQFEAFADETTVNTAIKARLFTTNGTAYKGDPAGSSTPGGSATPPVWMISEITYQKVRLPDSSGNFTDAYMMGYLMERNSKPGGWWDRMPLVDNFAKVDGVVTAVRDLYVGQHVTKIKLNLDGTPLDPQTDPLVYQDFVVQPNLAWTFLRDDL